LQKVNDKTKAITRIFTNGSALTLKRAEELHNIDNLELWISLNEHDEDRYKEVMGIDFNKTVKNIDALHETDFCHKVKLLKVGRDEGFKAYCKERWPDYEAIIIKKDGWLGYTEPAPNKIGDACDRWFELSIMADGKVSLCCMDGTGEYAIGDINTQTMREVYNTPEYKARRLGDVKRGEVSPCSTCNY
jgi:radical SAM protein with 4Fe4S-binding SPASM domain